MISSRSDEGGAASRKELASPGIRPGSQPGKLQIFGIETTVVRFNNAEYFVPDYALQRPVSKKVLGKRKASPALDRFVGRVLKRRPGNMVHAGTFFGDMLPSFSRKTPGMVYAFEPVLENYLLAHAVVEANRLQNVLLMHSALGASTGVATLGVARGKRKRHLGGAARVLVPETKKPHSRTQLTPVLTVDQLRIEDLALIQLDTEGYELPILQGAAETIRAQWPVIVVEDNKDNCEEFLARLGYVNVGLISGDTVYADPASTEDLTDLVSSRRRPR